MGFLKSAKPRVKSGSNYIHCETSVHAIYTYWNRDQVAKGAGTAVQCNYILVLDLYTVWEIVNKAVDLYLPERVMKGFVFLKSLSPWESYERFCLPQISVTYFA